MPRRSALLLFSLLCGSTVPLAAQTAQAPSSQRSTPPASPVAGPRLEPGFPSYQPSLRNDASSAVAVAADKTVITISTLGLVLLIVLLIILIA